VKILIYSIYLSEGTDGVSMCTRGLVSALEHTGLDVTICTTDLGWAEKKIQEQRSKKLRIFKAWSSNGADFAPDLFIYLMKNCRHFDVVQLHGTFNFPTVFGAYVARVSKTPYIVCPRGNFIPTSKIQKHVRNAIFKKLFFRLLARKTLIKANWVVCSSNMELNATKKLIHTNNLTSIPEGLNISFYLQQIAPDILKDKLGIDPERPLFLFLGRLAKEKAIPFLIDVWDLIIKNVPNALLVIAGANDSNQGLQKKLVNNIATLHRPESILMPGVVIGDLKLALLQHSRCLLLPSYYESFGNVVLESLASGTPVIASIGTPWKTLEENHFGKWLPWDVNIWAEAMINISRDNTYQNDNFLKRSRQWVIDNFNWDNIADQYINLYKEVINQHR
jgi:glycosyltransferase involved in cell wall biosynthesis